MKSLIGSALVGLDVRQHARAESISKRAQSTTLTSLRLESGTYEQSSQIIAHAGHRRSVFVDHVSNQQLASARSASPLELCQTVKSCLTPYSRHCRSRAQVDSDLTGGYFVGANGFGSACQLRITLSWRGTDPASR